MRSRISLAFSFLIIVFFTLSGSASAEKILKASHQWNTKDVRHTMLQIIADEVAKANAGIKVKIYPKKALYKPKAQWKPLTTGELALSAFPLAYAGKVHPEFDITLMPGLVKNHDHAGQLNNSSYMKEIKRIINKAGVIVIADTWLAGGFASKKNCILEPSDIRGHASRAAGKAFDQMLAGAGAKINNMPSSAIYKALQENRLHSANTSSGSFVSYRIYEQVKCLTIPGRNALWFMYEPILMSKRVFTRLTARQKNVILSAGKKAEKYFATQARDLDNILAETYRKAGVKVVEMSDTQAAKWRAIAKRTSYASFAKRVPGGQKLITQALGEFDLWTSNVRLSPYEQAKANTNKHTVSVITGGTSGASTNFAMDMAYVLNAQDGHGLRILPMIGSIGEQNIRDILFLKGVDMGITHAGYLSYLKKKDPKLFANIHNSIRYISKLYNAELHVIARKGIKTLADLNGKRVNFTEPENSRGFSAEAIFENLGIKVQSVHIDTKLAVQKVISGELDAATVFDGAPVTAFHDIPKESGVHFVPIDIPVKAETQLLPAGLKHEYYPNLIPKGQVIPTLSSSMVLAVYNWKKKNPRYKKLEVFVNKFFSQISDFQNQARHSKWEHINVAAGVPGWKRFGPAAEFLSALEYRMEKVEGINEVASINSGDVDPTFEEFQQWVSRRLKNDKADINKLGLLFKEFQDFHRWRSKEN